MPNPILNRRCAGNPYPMVGLVNANSTSNYAEMNDTTGLSIGAGLDMTIACWYYPLAVATDTDALVSKWAASNNEYALQMNATSNFTMTATNNGTTSVVATATTFGSVAANAWYFVVGQYDFANTRLQISVNAGAANTSAALATGVFDGTAPFRVGLLGTGFNPMNGVIDCVGIWKSASTAGGLLTAAQITTLYNNGVGMAYRDLPTSLSSTALLQAWWDFDNNLIDRTGVHTLSRNGNIGFTAGKR
jgi:hypothetical protein